MKLQRIFCLVFLVCGVSSLAAAKDYIQYHKNIIAAENEIFLNNNAAAGLALFKKTFTDYDFVYVDDCIEAFELALYCKKDELATVFIKKAIDNGFEPHLLELLNNGCPCNLYADRKKVVIWQPYMATHSQMLQVYFESVYPRYLARLDKHLIAALWQRHVKEQLFKNFHPGLVFTAEERDAMPAEQKAYAAVCDDNLRFMDSLAMHGIFAGERNAGLYTLHLAEQLQLPTIDTICRKLLRYYNLPSGTYVPVDAESDYFDQNPVFNMLFHNKKSYDVLAGYSDTAIRKGYLHPREFATLLYNGRDAPHPAGEMHLLPRKTVAPDRNAENALREKYYLPSYECDSAKHAFAHANGLRLNFGFRNGSK